jgi:hypothetical protein
VTQVLHPGARHPYAPMPLSELARFVHVPVTEVARWVAEGLPQTADGRIDPFVCSNWLCHGRLDRCPTLARRWRTYLLFFAPFLAGQDRVRRLRWKRTQRLYLPVPVEQLSWWLPRAATTASQLVESEDAPHVDACATSDAGGWWRIDGRPTTQEPTFTTNATVHLTPRQVLSPESADYAEFVAVMEDVVGSFRYEYRHHQPWEFRTAFTTGQVDEVRSAGSCLDCALAVGARLSQKKRPWRVVAGLVADSRIANPHFWIEVDTTAGWAPLDPTLPTMCTWSAVTGARRYVRGPVPAMRGGSPWEWLAPASPPSLGDRPRAR